MYFGEAAILSESYLDNIFNHTQMILDSEKFINSLYEADGNKENIFIRIFKFIKEKIIAVINALKNVYKWIVTKIKEFKDKHSKSKLDDVKIVGATKDEETAEEVINNFKDAVNKANEEVKSAMKDMEDTKTNAMNNIKQNHEILHQYMKDITESINKNIENIEDSKSNIDELLKDISDDLDDLLNDEDKSTSKNLPAVVGEKKKFAILVNKEDTIELINFGALCINLTNKGIDIRSRIISKNRQSIDKLIELYLKYDKNNISLSYDDFSEFLEKDINNFDSLKNELENILKIESTPESAKKIFHFLEPVSKGFKHYKQFGRVEYVSENFESNIEWINKVIETLKEMQDKFESRITEIENKNNDEYSNKSDALEALNKYKNDTIEDLKICNYLSSYIGRCIIASQQQKLRFENWLAEHLKFIYY